tara:strand:- start:7821 stop:7973 length:153 start_codon:yes stop_codon:yes gene_type:complete
MVSHTERKFSSAEYRTRWKGKRPASEEELVRYSHEGIFRSVYDTVFMRGL